MRRRGRDHRLATFLFTDIVGSSMVAAELADRKWRVLLSRHHAIVRKELKRYRGNELDTAGDGFFAVFDEPSDAVRCACAVSEAVQELGIEVRAGLNLGEAEVIDGKFGGMAVHAAARVMALGGPGEVIITSTIKDIVPGSGFTFDDRGTHQLRDVPGAWRLFSVTGVDGHPRTAPLPQDEAAARRLSIAPPPLLQRRGGRIAIAAVAVVLVGLATAALIAARKTPPRATSELFDNVVEVDPVSGKALATIHVGHEPSAIAFGEGSVWVTNSTDGTVTRIDPATLAMATIRVGHSPDSIAVAAGHVWVANNIGGTVSKIDPSTNDVIDTIDLHVGSGTMIAADTATDSVWVSTHLPDFGEFKVSRIDVTSGEVRVAFTGGCCFHGALAAGEGSVWFAPDDGDIVRLNARTGEIVKRLHEGAFFTAATIGNGEAWFASVSAACGGEPSSFPRALKNCSGGLITPVDLATDKIGPPASVGGGPSGLCVINGQVFTGTAQGALVQYAGGAVIGPAIQFEGFITGVVSGGGELWTSVDVP